MSSCYAVVAMMFKEIPYNTVAHLAVNFSQAWLANFAGLLGSSARKSVQWTDFSENGLASPGGKSRNLQAADG